MGDVDVGKEKPIRKFPRPPFVSSFCLTTMSHKRVDSASTILTILSCSSNEFSEFYDGPYATHLLVEDAKRIIHRNQAILKEANQDRYRLDELLLGMLEHAPDPSGQRYVAVVLHIANTKGTGAVTEAAKAWLDYLFFPSPYQTCCIFILTNSRTLSVSFVKDHESDAQRYANAQFQCYGAANRGSHSIGTKSF